MAEHAAAAGSSAPRGGDLRASSPDHVVAAAGGVVLAGGRSSRMGRPKAWLEWHGSTLLRRVVGIVARGAGGPMVVVRAPGQELPVLPAAVLVVDDAAEGRGPLMGLAAGLGALEGRAAAAFVSSVDVPLLTPAFVRRVLDGLDDETDVVLPRALGHPHPLAAAYRVSVLPIVRRLIAEDRMRPAFIFDEARTLRLGDEDLRPADPELDSLLNLNEPADYQQARARPAPEVRVQRFGALRPAGEHAPLAVSAATLGAAAAAAGLALDDHVVAALNGDQITRDPETPLVPDDEIAFMAADAGG
jgi:molybdopterin-guanine dinucleotide biosynthesis protein A